MNTIGYVYALATLLAMLAYGADKVAARSGGWRISEKTLLTLSVFGGCFGAIVAMLVFRHKTRKLKFWLVNIIASIIHAMILSLLLVR